MDMGKKRKALKDKLVKAVIVILKSVLHIVVVKTETTTQKGKKKV